MGGSLILQAFRRFTYVAAHSPTLPSFYLRRSSFFNPSVASPTVTAHSPTLLSLVLHHRIFTYVTWRAAHVKEAIKEQIGKGYKHHFKEQNVCLVKSYKYIFSLIIKARVTLYYFLKVL